MITIKNLEVRFEVEGDDDKKNFAKMFTECIDKWSAEYEQAKSREIELSRDSSLEPGSNGAVTQ